jgi:dipeptidyl aminopeptidase/acylaminoacyl peptidase
MLTVDEVLAFRSVNGARISPDGSAVVYEVGAALAGADADIGTHLWLVDVAGGTPRQLTHGTGKDTAAAWSPDGQTIAFLSDRVGDGTRLFLLPRGGGEAQPLATGDGALKGFAWSPDGSAIAFLRTDPEPEATKGMKNAPIVVEEAFRYDRLWTITLADGAVRRTTDTTAHIWEFAWFADSAALAVVAADNPTEAAWYGCRLARLDLATGALTTLHQPPNGRQVARPAPAPDGRTVACVVCAWSDSGMSGGDLWLVPSDPHGDNASRNLTTGADFSVYMATWQPGGRDLLALAYDGLGVSLSLIAAERPGSWRCLWQGPYRFGFGGIHPADDGLTFATQRSAAREPDDLWLGTIADGAIAWRALADTHGDRRTVLTADFTAVAWAAADGLELHGLLMRPLGATGPVPLVTLVHGGPTGVSSHGFTSRGLNALAPLLAARGIATFLPNYRGSNGRGVVFAEANHGDMGGNDWTDITAGIDRLIADGIADPDHLGLAGWSYGGYMTMWG